MSSEVSVGVSIGGEYACCAIHNTSAPGRYDVAANDIGDRTTPCVVAFDKTNTIVGTPAKALKVRNPKSTITNVVQLLNPTLVAEKKFELGFDTEIEKNADGEQIVKMNTADASGEDGALVPHDSAEVFQLLLKGLKKTVVDGACSGANPAAVTIAVPRYIDRAIVEKSADAAGYGAAKLRVIASDVAAVMAQRFNAEAKDAANVKLASTVGTPYTEETSYLVVDWGGSSCAASLIVAKAGGLSLQAYEVDFTLGGSNVMDKELVKMAAEGFQKKTKINPNESRKSMRKLVADIQPVKHALSTAMTSSIEIEAFCEGVDLRESLARMKFEMAIRSTKIIGKVVDLVNKVVTKGFVAPDHKDGTHTPAISEIILLGGTCKIPLVMKTLKVQLAQNIDPDHLDQDSINDECMDGFKCDAFAGDEAAAVGACMQATVMSSSEAAETATTALEGVHTDDGVSVPTLGQTVGIILGGGKTDDGEIDAANVAVLARQGSLVPLSIPMTLPANLTADSAIRLCVATGAEHKNFKAFGKAVNVGSLGKKAAININLRASKHDGLEVRICKGLSSPDLVEGGDMSVDLHA